jgi:hypothetical protein
MLCSCALVRLLNLPPKDMGLGVGALVAEARERVPAQLLALLMRIIEAEKVGPSSYEDFDDGWGGRASCSNWRWRVVKSPLSQV